MEIRETDFGIANNYGSHIEINRHLKAENPKLYQAILNHELAHSDEKGFSKDDFVLDVGEHKISTWQLAKFMIRHPKSFMQLAPLYKKDGVWFYDINMIIFWFVLSVVITVPLIVF